jgi:hypothetical protein
MKWQGCRLITCPQTRRKRKISGIKMSRPEIAIAETFVESWRRFCLRCLTPGLPSYDSRMSLKGTRAVAKSSIARSDSDEAIHRSAYAEALLRFARNCTAMTKREA